ncbi:XRE family transcriptional regulator [Streptomyces javensis]|uniref:XRE family transcriptional regulator n=1 Tax=Streptomyces javensis TaxID=114698 RepID=A0ABS0R772_9ACTN|nr:XRE family transcriptional regulator [Streptomyces javensis]MBI0312721.1 XRE family transcriptional regulator [Streptomyces javensis]
MTTTVRKWTGHEATVLRTVLRMSIRGYAERLGVSPSMVMEWKNRGRTLVPVPETQKILDTFLAQRTPEEREAFFAELSATASEGAPGSAGRAPAELARLEPAADVVASQRRWREVRRYLNANRETLSRAAAELYDPALRIGGTPMLMAPAWRAAQPVPLDQVELVWSETVPDALVTGSEPEAVATHPLRAPGVRFDRYTLAIRYIDAPTLFENRPSYRLTAASWASGQGRLTFGLASYFDKLDLCEAVGHEFAAACMEDQDQGASAGPAWGDLPLRRLVDDPFDPALRAVTPAITTLLIRQRQDGSATFLLHWRDPAKVATAGGLYDAVPAGEFQPGSVMSAQSPQDFDLWRNIVRELNEELLGAPEFDGSGGPLQYERWPLWRTLERARLEGRVRAFAFGVGVDPLTLAVAIPSVLVIDDQLFDRLFGDIAAENAEGVTVTRWAGQDVRNGIPFTDQNVTQFIKNEPMAPPGAACLALAWQYRDLLLSR